VAGARHPGRSRAQSRPSLRPGRLGDHRPLGRHPARLQARPRRPRQDSRRPRPPPRHLNNPQRVLRARKRAGRPALRAQGSHRCRKSGWGGPAPKSVSLASAAAERAVWDGQGGRSRPRRRYRPPRPRTRRHLHRHRPRLWHRGPRWARGSAAGGGRCSCRPRPALAAANGWSPRRSSARPIDDSLGALRTDHIDLYHLHGVTPGQYDHCVAVLIPELKRQQAAGKVRFLGVTEMFGRDTGHEMLVRALPDDQFDVVMTGFNLLNPSARTRVFPMTRARDVGTLIMFAVRRVLSDPAALREVVAQLVERETLTPAWSTSPTRWRSCAAGPISARWSRRPIAFAATSPAPMSC